MKLSSKLQATANVTFLKGRISFCMDQFANVTGKTDKQALARENSNDKISYSVPFMRITNGQTDINT